MVRRVGFLAGVVVVLQVALGASFAGEAPKVTADEALKKLMEGNKHYVETQFANPDRSVERRAEVAKGQAPFAIILGCSDSRVPPELIFDQGLGDLFVIRTAGNVVDDIALGSMEYGAEHLGVPLLVVLGHERCGAVQATAKGGEAPGHIGALVKAISPAVKKAKGQPGDLVDNAVKANVELVAAKIKTSKPILAELVKEGKLKVVGARYDLDTGVVELLQ